MYYFGREIVIDYAHNAESIEAIAKNNRPFCQGRMLAVSGAVGDKARERRKPLVRVLEAYFDLSVLTEDDTLVEDRKEITSELYSYFQCKEKAHIVTERENAILHALSISKEGDMIFLLGKGHEKFLVRNGVKHPFDEREIVTTYFHKTSE